MIRWLLKQCGCIVRIKSANMYESNDGTVIKVYIDKNPDAKDISHELYVLLDKHGYYRRSWFWE